MGFESVYRVSPRRLIPAEEEINSLGQALGMELPLGYREYVRSFGLGALCTFVIARTPEQIRTPTKEDEYWRELLIDNDYESGTDAGLAKADLEQAVVFAYASAEAPFWFATRTLGSRLFENAEGETTEIENGFYGLVERCAEGQNHEFPFFEPKNGRRRMRQLNIRPGVGRAGFADALARRWGRDAVRCTRSSQEELFPVYLVPAIEAYISLHLDTRYNQDLPAGAFFVRACYDIDSEADFAAFVEPLLLPGGGPPHQHRRTVLAAMSLCRGTPIAESAARVGW